MVLSAARGPAVFGLALFFVRNLPSLAAASGSCWEGYTLFFLAFLRSFMLYNVGKIGDRQLSEPNKSFYILSELPGS